MADHPGDLEIVRYGHPALRTRAKPVGRVGREVARLVEGMVDLMRNAHGVGLAANQIGIARRIAVVEVDGDLTPLIDPEIVSARGAEVSDEGCLSLPRLYGLVSRPAQVTVRARALSGERITIEGEGLLARALCHEVDHLNGRLFIDSAEDASLYWLVGHTEEGEPIVEPTSLENALKVFGAARG